MLSVRCILGILVADFSLIQSTFWKYIVCAIVILAGRYVSHKIESTRQSLNSSNGQLHGFENED